MASTLAIALQGRSFEDYRSVVGSESIDRLLEIARRLKGVRVVHVNSTAFGGGVAEILRSMVPLMTSVGLKAEWLVITPPPEFFNVTKKIHNGLQGMEVTLTNEEKEFYMNILSHSAEYLDFSDGDIIMIHDPQPMGLRILKEWGGRWIWRCHIDLSTPYQPIWEFVRGMLSRYHASIFHLKEFVKSDTPTPRVYVIPPSIDPLSPKNIMLSESEVDRILERYGINREKPVLLQVARFDPWKDPFSAVNVYRKVREKIGDAQLLLVSSIPPDDPDSPVYLKKVLGYIDGDRNIFILTNREGVGSIEVNAFQRAATVALQMSIREGFGLAVSEALWKGTPVVARPTGGIKLQVIHGVTGYLAESVEEAANYVTLLIRKPELRRELGANGHRHVKENFVITKHLEQYLRVYAELLGIEVPGKDSGSW